MPAAARLSADGDTVCLTNRRFSLGFPGKRVELRHGARTATLQTGKGGCAALPPGDWRRARAAFDGDGSVKPARAVVR